MSKRKFISIGAFSLLVFGVGSAFAVNNADQPAPQAPAVISGVKTAENRLSASDREALSAHVARVSEFRSSGPNAETTDIAKGRVLINREGIRLAVTSSTDGGACYVADVFGDPTNTGCFEEFLPIGVMPSIDTQGESEWFAYGVAADDVTDVSIRYADGRLDRAALEKNAFVWRGDAAGAEALVVTRAGASQEMPLRG